jgi:hypothetical protein
VSTVTTCPCCNSTVAVDDDGTLGIVRIAKPEPGSEWKPRRRRGGGHRVAPVPMDEDRAREVVERVAGEYGLTLDDLRSRDRSFRLVHIRRAAMRAAREETEASLPQIGRVLDRDHTTVLSALRTLEAVA